MDQKKTKVLMFGTFDILHPGHIKIFSEAAKLGDELYVVVARDATVEKVKGRKTHYDEQTRLMHIRAVTCITKVMLGSLDDKYAILDIVKPDIIALGYDQKFFIDKLEEELVKRNLKTKIIHLGPYKPQIYKSSKIRAKLDSNA
ncbi:FAD synthase [Candidatus Woesearchaeota archaeon CG08_land_8_20_14_0_20_43_7]|nr:MAG: FAD synthase [Candidatus Woesearchaeota archaeon CG08_land_8_20_14_0_20_43_7]